MNKIRWMAVPLYEGIYECSDRGRVKSLKRKGKLKDTILRIRKDSIGYSNVILCVPGSQVCYKVHRLVATLFVSNPYNKPHVNHKDGVKLNNNYSNLEWCTRSENIKHAHLTGLRVPPTTKLKKEDVLFILNSSENAITLSKKYSISKRTVYQIKIGQTWKHITGGNYSPIKKIK